MIVECLLAKYRKIGLGQFVNALAEHFESRPPLGQIALRSRMLSMKELFAILSRQLDHDGSFGKIAIETGILTEAQVAILLMKQSDLATPVGELLVKAGAITQEKLDAERNQVRRESLELVRRSAKQRGSDDSTSEFARISNERCEATYAL